MSANGKKKNDDEMCLFYFCLTSSSQEQMIYLRITILFILVVLSGMFLWNPSSDGSALHEAGTL